MNEPTKTTARRRDPVAARLLTETLRGIRSYVVAVERLERSALSIPLKGLLREHVDAGRVLRPAARPEVPVSAPFAPERVDPWPEVEAANDVGPLRRRGRRLLAALRDAESESLRRFVRELRHGALDDDVREAVLEVLLPRQRRRIERLDRLIEAPEAAAAPSTRRPPPGP